LWVNHLEAIAKEEPTASNGDCAQFCAHPAEKRHPLRHFLKGEHTAVKS